MVFSKKDFKSRTNFSQYNFFLKPLINQKREVKADDFKRKKEAISLPFFIVLIVNLFHVNYFFNHRIAAYSQFYEIDARGRPAEGVPV